MRQDQKSKLVVMRAPMEVASRGNNTSEACDTQGFNEALVVLARGPGASDAAACYMTESDDDSTYTTIAETEFGNAACVGIDGTAIVLGDLGADETVVFSIDLIKRKRYLKVYFNNTNGAVDWTVTALLGEPSNLGDLTSTVLVSSEGSGTEAYCRVPVGG